MVVGFAMLQVVGGEQRAEALHEALERRRVPHPDIAEVVGDGPGHVRVLP
jgi:hypothetical protein